MSFVFSIQHIDWREPLWLIVALQPFGLYLIKRFIQQNTLSAYADKNLQPWIIFPAGFSFSSQSLISILFNKNTAYILAWLLFAISMAGPRIPISQNNNEKILSANIMIVVDVSRSMKATDLQPNRLDRVKIEINELLVKAKNHRIGLTVFSARAHLFVPVTYDHAALKTYLEMLDDLTFPTLGSNPVAAILLAKKELQQIKGKSAIILITDGDLSSPLDITSYNQLDSLKQENIPLYILGAGTVEGEAIQLEDGTWLKYMQQPVISKLQQDSLIDLANRYNGNYSAIYDDDSDWETLYDQGIRQINSSSALENKQYILWDELYIYFLLPSLFLFILALTPYQLRIFKNSTVTILLLLVITSYPNNDVMAFELTTNSQKEAFNAYKNGDYKEAEKLYKSFTGYKSYFGQGNSLYKMGHYQKAQSQFTQAILTAESDAQRANALYNLANSYFRIGDFSSAISSYEDVLRYQTNHAASLYNINVSQILKKNIERRTKEREEIFTSTRTGRGPRTAHAAEGTEISDNTSVSTGDSSNQLNNKIPLPDLPNLSEDTIKKLLLSGLDSIKLAENNQQLFEQDQSYYKNIDIITAKQQLEVLTDSQHLLWKRLFEMEEGFPAPVETPHTLPGVKPW